MTHSDVRWRQRLQSYTRAVSLLDEAVSQGPERLNTLEKEGTVQRFEFTLELGWNLLKDYLEASGVELASVTPKSVIKSAFAARLIDQGQTWADMLQWRNNLSHRNDDALLESGMTKICRDFLPAFVALRDKLTELDGTGP
jgi:nucleotidyltransferase substrate binding protein (TIGR01987 family)